MTKLFDEADARAEATDDTDQLRKLRDSMKALLSPMQDAYKKFDACGESWNALAYDIGRLDKLIERLETNICHGHFRRMVV